jgi:putative ABC transport system substrate-binding protein
LSAARGGRLGRALRAQQSGLPIVGFVNTGSAEGLKSRATAFRKGLSEAGFVEGKDVTIEFHWLEGRTDQLAAVMADLVKRKVAVIATPGSVVAALAAKAATTSIPIVFGVPEDPVRLGLLQISRPAAMRTHRYLPGSDRQRCGCCMTMPKTTRAARQSG